MGTFGVGIWQLAITGLVSALSAFGLYHDPSLTQKLFEAELKALATYVRAEGFQFSYDRVRYSDSDVAIIDNVVLSIPVDEHCIADAKITPVDPNLGLPLVNPCFADLRFRAIKVTGLGVSKETAPSYKLSFENGYLDLATLNSAQAKVLKRLLSLENQLRINVEIDGVYLIANDRLDLAFEFDLPQLFTVTSKIGLGRFVNDPVYGFSPQRIHYSEFTLQDNGGMIPLSEVIMAADTASTVGLPSMINEVFKVPNDDVEAYAQLFPDLGPNLSAFKAFFEGEKATKCERTRPLDISFSGPAFAFYQENLGVMIGVFCENVTTVPSVTVTRESRATRLQAEKALAAWKRPVHDQRSDKPVEDSEMIRAIEQVERNQQSEQRVAKAKILSESFVKAEAEAKRKGIESRERPAIAKKVTPIVSERATAAALNSMTTRITRAWRRPVTFQAGLEVDLNVALAANGEVVEVRVIRSSGEQIFDRSAVSAVQRASPFQEVAQFDALTFENNFRSMTIKFKPEG